MIKIDNLKILAQEDMTPIDIAITKKLGIDRQDLLDYKIMKQSIDARRKPEIYYTYTIYAKFSDEEKYYDKYLKVDIDESEYVFDTTKVNSSKKIVVVGAGPSGLFLSYRLALSGLNPIVIERGKSAKERAHDIELLMTNGTLNKESNVLFGLGGAGTFSDGKLNTGTNNPLIKKVLRTFTLCGAPSEIEYVGKPHIGSDKLISVVENLKDKIVALGGKFLFEHKMVDILVSDNKVSGVVVERNGEKTTLDTDYLCLCVGHSARDTFRLFKTKNMTIEPKPFSMGVRIEHRRQDINFSQYAISDAKYLPTADYKIFEHLPNGRTVYSFCMCPGGVVVPAMSEENTINVNGMSYFDRHRDNSNSAILVNVDPSDYFDGDSLSGVNYQEKWERKAYELSNDIGGGYVAPIETLNSFLYGKENILGKVKPSYSPKVKLCDLKMALPKFVSESIKMALPKLNNKIKGFSDKDAVLTGIETRSSSPIKISRDNDTLMSDDIIGVYPCGEGCGYAGGIVSSAVDGIKVAEKIISLIQKR